MGRDFVNSLRANRLLLWVLLLFVSYTIDLVSNVMVKGVNHLFISRFETIKKKKNN